MKPATIFVETVIIACLLTGVGLTFDKLESASISNPFRIRTAQLQTNN